MNEIKSNYLFKYSKKLQKENQKKFIWKMKLIANICFEDGNSRKKEEGFCSIKMCWIIWSISSPRNICNWMFLDFDILNDKWRRMKEEPNYSSNNWILDLTE